MQAKPKSKRTGKGGFKDNPQNRNTKGRPKGSRSIPDILRKIGEQQKQSSELGKVDKLQMLLDTVYTLALQGEKWAVEFIADRTEGKAITTNVNIEADTKLLSSDMIDEV